MAKFVEILLVIGFIVCSSASLVVKQDVSELLRNRESGYVYYGSGIPGHQAEIENVHFNIDKAGSYNFNYKQTDLQEREEAGHVKRNSVTGKRELDSVIGSYKYVRPDGLWQIVAYRADKNGFVPSITVTRDEVSHDPPQILGGLVPAFPILPSTESSSTSTTATSESY